MRTPHVPNQTQRRARGFGLGNSIKGPLAIKANEECYYTQPGWPLDTRHRRPRKVCTRLEHEHMLVRSCQLTGGSQRACFVNLAHSRSGGA